MVPHARDGRVESVTALAFGGAGIAGAFLGAALNRLVSGPVLLLLFGILMLVVALRMIFGKTPADAEGTLDVRQGFRWSALVAGLVVGVMTGFFGVGGGFLIVPALVLVLGFPMRLAVGTSLMIITINSGSGMIAHLGSGSINFPVAALFIIGELIGSVLGSRLASQVNETLLSRAFAAFVMLMGFFLILQNTFALV